MQQPAGVEAAVTKWLEETGHRLEYQTHGAFRRANISATMGSYVRSSEGTLREIDVMTLDKRGRLLFRVLCECKYSADHPWVLLDSGTPPNLEMDWQMLPKSVGLAEVPSNRIENYRARLERCLHFSTSARFAHSIVQAFGKRPKGDRDVAYDALQKIANAAWDFAELGARHPFEPEPLIVAFPCLVVDAPLLTAQFDDERGEFTALKVPFGRLSWLGCRSGTVVDVVQVSALDDYVKAVKGTIRGLHEMLSDWLGNG